MYSSSFPCVLPHINLWITLHGAKLLFLGFCHLPTVYPLFHSQVYLSDFFITFVQFLKLLLTIQFLSYSPHHRLHEPLLNVNFFSHMQCYYLFILFCKSAVLCHVFFQIFSTTLTSSSIVCDLYSHSFDTKFLFCTTVQEVFLFLLKLLSFYEVNFFL
jgi:hypothetical protein